MNTANKTLVIDFLTKSVLDIDFNYFLSGNEFETVEDIREILDDNQAFEVEIIYYATAIEYLKENDNSLHVSLGLAADMDYDLRNLSSEVLASLLASENCRNDWSNLENELEYFIDNLEDDSEEVENDN